MKSENHKPERDFAEPPVVFDDAVVSAAAALEAADQELSDSLLPGGRHEAALHARQRQVQVRRPEGGSPARGVGPFRHRPAPGLRGTVGAPAERLQLPARAVRGAMGRQAGRGRRACRGVLRRSLPRRRSEGRFRSLTLHTRVARLAALPKSLRVRRV